MRKNLRQFLLAALAAAVLLSGCGGGGSASGSASGSVSASAAASGSLSEPAGFQAPDRSAESSSGTHYNAQPPTSASAAASNPAPDKSEGEPAQNPAGPAAAAATAAAVTLKEAPEAFQVSSVPAYSGQAYVAVHDNIPYFDTASLTPVSTEYYSDLDDLGRCGVTYACVGQDIMPTEERGSIGQVKPTCWHTIRSFLRQCGWQVSV